MSKQTKTVTTEVWVCDSCGAETGLPVATCGVCNVELCHRCSRTFDVELLDWNNGSGAMYGGFSIADKTGWRASFCLSDWERAEETLRAIGFREFRHVVNPV